jgi:hypothetical protein
MDERSVETVAIEAEINEIQSLDLSTRFARAGA